MHFEPDKVYHIYNRGNNKQKVFFNNNHYLFFLKKVRQEWLSYCHILAYCLMPNHFHFLIVPNTIGCNKVVLKEKETHLQYLSKAIGKTLSSYTQAINIEQARTGNLFQKKTKAKLLEGYTPQTNGNYIIACLAYIHANPVLARLCTIETEWIFSSAKEYAGLRSGTLCSKEVLYQKSGLSEMDFKNKSKVKLTKEIVNNLF